MHTNTSLLAEVNVKQLLWGHLVSRKTHLNLMHCLFHFSNHSLFCWHFSCYTNPNSWGHCMLCTTEWCIQQHSLFIPLPFILCWVDLFSLFTAAAQFCGFTPHGLSSGACQRAPTASAAVWRPLLLLSQESATTMMLLCSSAICHKQMENTQFPLPRAAFCTSYRETQIQDSSWWFSSQELFAL